MTSRIVPGNVQNVVTEYRYGPGGQLVERVAKNPVTGDQVTRYEYGTTLKESGIASNNLLRAEIYPDAKDSSDRVKYSYNRQGQRTRMQDQNGSVHEYEHDLLGRQTADKVATLGAGVDGAVRRIGTSYEVRGLVEKITSFSDAAGTTPVNEVQNVFNSFAQLAEQYQEHDGAVNTGTTPKVQYAYADGSENTIRPTSMTYPNGRVLDYLYDDEAADKLSRIRTLRFDGTDVCRYAYLGLNTFVTVQYPEPGIEYNLATGAGANRYAGLDRYGRIVDLLWQRTDISSSSSSSSSGSGPGDVLVHLKYGYDRASNRTHRQDLVAQSHGKHFDELYEYDGLHRLKKFHRGRLIDNNTVIESPTLQQGWVLDATGNWRNFTQNDQADADQVLDQQRLHNRVNEITQIARTVGADWATPEYDRNGNMTVIPQPKEMTQTFQGTWDAWNRLVKLTEPNGSGGWQTLAEYQYDGQTWRTAAKSYASGVLDETRHFYFTSRWQDIEERLGTTPSSATANRQFAWGQRYIDDLVLRDRDTFGDGDLDERLYALQDGNWNVVASSNAHLSYVSYSPYGTLTSTGSPGEYLFGGYYFNESSGLYLCRFRWFAPPLGIYLSRDPVGYAGSNLRSLIAYADDRPLTQTDAFGLLAPLAPVAAPAVAPAAGGGVAAAVGPWVLPVSAGIGLGFALDHYVTGKFFTDVYVRVDIGTECLRRRRQTCRDRHPVWDACAPYRERYPSNVASEFLRASCPKIPLQIAECIPISDIKPACGPSGGYQLHCLIADPTGTVANVDWYAVSVRCCNCCTRDVNSRESWQCSDAHWSERALRYGSPTARPIECR